MSTTPTNQPDPQIVMLKNVRLSYPQLFVAKAQGEDSTSAKLKYSASFILDKKQHAALIKSIEALVERTALTEFKKKVPLKHKVLRDGNEKSDKDGYGDEVMFISASSEKRPVVVDADKTPLGPDDARPYAGCYVNATIRVFAYEHKTGGKGVSAALRGVQFVKDGESFGAAPVDADKEFEDVSTSADDEAFK